MTDKERADKMFDDAVAATVFDWREIFERHLREHTKVAALEDRIAAMKLTWTKTPPTVPGWYWFCKRRTDHSGMFLHSQIDARVLWVEDGRACGSTWMFDVDRMGGEWAGPIPEPGEAT